MININTRYGATKTVNNTTTDFVWNGQNLVSEMKNDTTTVYTYDPTGIISSKTGSEVTRFVKDPHGNVVATSKSDSIFGTYNYTAFGNQTESTDTTNPFRYCGEYYDDESGLTYLRNRYYNSTTGRFLTEDPAKDGVNWYVYGNNNPVVFVDPWGLTSRGAQVYIDYYNQQSLAAQENMENISNGQYEDWELEELGYRCEDEVNFANSRIADIIELDKRGLIEGDVLNVPLHNQYAFAPEYPGENWCWAGCISMAMGLYLEDDENRTKDIAMYIYELLGEDEYDVPREWYSTDMFSDDIDESQEMLYDTISFRTIARTIKDGRIFAALYGAEDNLGRWSGHWVLGIGYAVTPADSGHPKLVVSNDPAGGVQRIQTYDEFTGNYVGDADPWRPWAHTAI